jgi:tryptophan halogenase
MLDRVLILGGGSAGFLTAITLKKILPYLKITVLKSSDLGIIGVGEGTTRDVPLHLHSILNLDPGEFYRDVRPSWKLGIRFLWGPREYYNYNFRRTLDLTLPKLTRPVSYFVFDDFENASLTSALMSENKVFARTPQGTPAIGHDVAYHLENETFVTWLEKTAQKLMIEVIDDLVVEVPRTDEGIGGLVLKSGRTLDAQIYVDCSGFRSVLLGQTLGEPFESFESSLFCDSAVVGGWARGANEPINSYTTAQTMNSGWCWQIEHENRINRGYVYSTKFISDEEADREFRSVAPKVEKTRIVRFKTGRYRRAWVKNVVAIGNACGFVEPLESTAISVICADALQLAFTLSDVAVFPSPSKVSAYNERSKIVWEHIRNFLAIHYRFNTRLDTPFWCAARADVNLAGAERIVQYYKENGPNPANRDLLVDRLDPFNYEGYLVHLLGQKVPCEFRYEPKPMDLEIMARHRKDALEQAKRGFTVEEALGIIHAPNWQWNPQFYKEVHNEWA